MFVVSCVHIYVQSLIVSLFISFLQFDLDGTSLFKTVVNWYLVIIHLEVFSEALQLLKSKNLNHF